MDQSLGKSTNQEGPCAESLVLCGGR
jgi:hypothetical protein